MKSWSTIVLSILLILLLLLAGFILGRCTSTHETDDVVVKVDTVYEKGDTIRETISHETLVPIKVTDTLIITEKIDTAQLFEVFQDYYRSREYELDFSNDTLGTFQVCTTVSENKLQAADATIVPMVKVVNTTKQIDKVKFIQGFVSVGTSVHNLSTQQITLGAEFKERWDVGVTGIRYNDNFSYTINFGVKF